MEWGTKPGRDSDVARLARPTAGLANWLMGLGGLFLAVLFTFAAGAGQVTLTWDPNPESDLGGYRVYFGAESRRYTNVLDVGAANIAVVPNLEDGKVYFFAVTAYNTQGLESDFSNEVALTVSSVLLPSVALTRPTPGQTFTAPANVSMTATVTANGHTITKVQFLQGNIVVGEDLTAPYSFTWRGVAAGNHSLKARTIFGSGSMVDSSPVPIVVNSTTPTVVLTSPVNDSYWELPASLELVAAVTANGNPITRVQFFSGSTFLGEDLVAPYSLTWTNPAVGTYSLSARVFWGTGFSASSPAVAVTVALPPPEIVLTSPESEQTFRSGAPISLRAAVAANGHTVTKVQFLVESRVVGEDASAPYEVTWSQAEVGSHDVVARMFYGAGQYLDSMAAFIDVLGLPEPWQSTDVGDLLESGWAAESFGMFELYGAGTMGMTVDGFHFAYQTLSGDGQITARLDGYSTGLPGAVQGVMIRESLTPGSTYMAMGVGSDGVYRFLRREVTGSPYLTKNSIAAIQSSTWLRVQREGQTLVALRSNDGLNWTRIGSRTIPMAANVYFGLFVTSGGVDSLGMARFTEVRAIP